MQPGWVDKNLFPFQSRWIEIAGHSLHYIDEGHGRTILFVHGTPEWSFGFRDLVKGLRQNFRCIAIDHLGFGLSDKPPAGDYTCQGHSSRLTQFIQQLDLRNISLVANDFGGGISMGYALNHPQNVDRIVLFNTWMWSLTGDPHYSRPARIMNSWLGRFLYLRLNAPVNAIMPSAYGDRKKLTKKIHDHYRRPVPDPVARVALYSFARELMNAAAWWDSLWNKLARINDNRFLFFWGMKDKFIPPRELEKWKTKLPNAKVIRFEDAGHFVQEEKASEMIPAIQQFLSKELN